MFRTFFVLLIVALTFKSDAQTAKVDCVLEGIEIDKYDCVSFNTYEYMMKQNCKNIPSCFKFEYEEAKPKDYFSYISKTDKRSVIEILDSSAVALLKNSKLKNIKIIFYNKGNKLDKEFIDDAQKYLLDKGVKKNQFKIEIRQ